MKIPKSGTLQAFAVIVDINGFTPMVARSSSVMIADFVRDTLIGSICAIEDCGGEVIGIMGDAVFGVIETSEQTAHACFAIAKDLDNLCGYLARGGPAGGAAYEFAPHGPSLKIGIEFGWLNVSSIQTRALGTQPFLIGPATNHAARILKAGEGNRCHIGPAAVSAGLDSYNPTGPLFINGKEAEPAYEYWKLNLGDIWIEGTPEDGVYHW